MQLDSEGLWIDPGRIGEDYGQYDPWLWRTGDIDCPLPQAEEVLPGSLLPNHQEAKHQEGSHTELLPLPSQPAMSHEGSDAASRPEGLPRIEGLPGSKRQPPQPAAPVLPPASLLPPPPLP
jgi:hypothetical protein